MRSPFRIWSVSGSRALRRVSAESGRAFIRLSALSRPARCWDEVQAMSIMASTTIIAKGAKNDFLMATKLRVWSDVPGVYSFRRQMLITLRRMAVMLNRLTTTSNSRPKPMAGSMDCSGICGKSSSMVCM